jgi:type I restriction enzyme R subunit
MTGPQYEKKVREYLFGHLDHLVIERLRTNQPLTETDLQGLETVLREIGEEDGPALLDDLKRRCDSPSLAWLVRSLVGLDRQTVRRAFERFLGDRSLGVRQIRFVEMVVEQLVSRGVMPLRDLFEPPFTAVHSGGPEALFGGKVKALFDSLDGLHTGLTKRVG